MASNYVERFPLLRHLTELQLANGPDDSMTSDEFRYAKAVYFGLDDAIIAVENFSGPWKSAALEHPRMDGRYLVVLKRDGLIQDWELHDKEIKILTYRTDTGWRYPTHIPKEINDSLTQKVTHWMVLPDMPEE